MSEDKSRLSQDQEYFLRELKENKLFRNEFLKVVNYDKERFKNMFLECLNTDQNFRGEIDKAYKIREYMLMNMEVLYKLQKDNDRLMKLVGMLGKSRRGNE